MHWVSVALSVDLPKGVAIPARVGDRDAVVWRSAAGHLQAWDDRCPHRGMRLSHGFVRGETLACIYHGWRYGRSGSCMHIPAHPALDPPKTIAVKGFKTLESQGIIWVSAADDPGQPPSLEGFEPLRSLPVERAADSVVKQLDSTGGAPAIVDGIAIVVQATGESAAMLHALLRKGESRKAASARLEALRRELERAA